MGGGNGGTREVYESYGRREWGGGGFVRFNNPMVGGNEGIREVYESSSRREWGTREVYESYGRWG